MEWGSGLPPSDLQHARHRHRSPPRERQAGPPPRHWRHHHPCRRAAPCALGTSRAARQAQPRHALLPERSPLLPPSTILGLRGVGVRFREGPKIVEDGTPERGAVVRLPFGSSSRPPRRHLPYALPVGAPLDIVGTRRTLQRGDSVPNIVKNGTPQRGQSRHPTERGHQGQV